MMTWMEYRRSRHCWSTRFCWKNYANVEWTNKNYSNDNYSYIAPASLWILTLLRDSTKVLDRLENEFYSFFLLLLLLLEISSFKSYRFQYSKFRMATFFTYFIVGNKSETILWNGVIKIRIKLAWFLGIKWLCSKIKNRRTHWANVDCKVVNRENKFQAVSHLVWVCWKAMI